MTEQIGVGGLTVELKLTKFDKRLIQRYRAETVYCRYGQMASIGRRQGKAISFRGMASIYPAGTAGSGSNASAPAALTEGTFPAAIQGTWIEIQATISQYGQVMRFSDLAEEQSIDDIVPETTENLSESMKDALDLLTRDVLMAGTNVQYASIAATRGGASGVGSGMFLNLAELREAIRTLKRNNVPPIAGNKYVAIGHVNTTYDLQDDPNITNIYQFGASERRQDELFGDAFEDLPFGIRWVETTNARIFSSAGLSAMDVYGTLVMGRGGYGVIDLAALPARIITKDRGSSGISDPLDQVATVGWKAAHAAVILKQEAVVRIEHGTSAMTMG